MKKSDSELLPDRIDSKIGSIHKQQFPSCNFSLLGLDEMTAFIAGRLSAAKPTSIMRLGDGEDMLLARPCSSDTILWERVNFHFGPKVTTEEINLLADMLTYTIEAADVIGVRADIINVHFN